MQVILLRDVAKIGRRGQVVDVPDGYAQNQLIPKRLAEPATLANQRRVVQKNAALEASQKADMKRLEEAVAKLKDQPLVVLVEANEQGHLFKAVSAKDVVQAAAGVGAVLETNEIQIPTPIKSLGNHTILATSQGQKMEVSIMVNRI